jgi:Fe-S-cluster containining protein
VSTSGRAGIGGEAGVPARFYRAFERQARAWDAEFSRVSARFADRMQCRNGCSACCSQMFPISLIEGAVLWRAVARLPDDRRVALRAAAHAYLAEARRLGLADSDADDTVVPRPGPRLPCPALQGDSCSLYEARPLICRKWGIPVVDPRAPDRLHACALNFRDGEALEAGDLVAPQRALLEAWAEVRADARGRLPEWRTTTIAEALVTDFSEVLDRAASDGGTHPAHRSDAGAS